MIKQAELRSVISDFQSYATAYNNFFGRYNKIPGDMDVASTYWGGGLCASPDNLCNGNNNGIIDYVNASATSEVNKAWKHLEQAKMINAGVVQLTGANLTSTQIGTNAPTSKVAAAGYVMIGGSNAVAAPPFQNFNNAVWLGKATANDTLLNAALVPEDAFSIDQKMDDGIVDSSGNFVGAITGSVRAKDGNGVTALSCVSDTTNGYYAISQTSETCRLGMTLN